MNIFSSFLITLFIHIATYFTKNYICYVEFSLNVDKQFLINFYYVYMKQIDDSSL